MEKSSDKTNRNTILVKSASDDKIVNIPQLANDIRSINGDLHYSALQRLVIAIVMEPKNIETVKQQDIVGVLNNFLVSSAPPELNELAIAILAVLGAHGKSRRKRSRALTSGWALIQIILNSDETLSRQGSEALHRLIVADEQVRNAMLSQRFVDLVFETLTDQEYIKKQYTTSTTPQYSAFQDEDEPNFVKVGLLSIVQKLAEEIENPTELGILIPILEEIKKNGEKELGKKAKTILGCLQQEGITVPSVQQDNNSNDDKIQQLEETIRRQEEQIRILSDGNEKERIENDENRRKIEEYQRKDADQILKRTNSQINLENNIHNGEEHKKKTVQFVINNQERGIQKSPSLVKIQNNTQSSQENKKKLVQFERQDSQKALQKSNSLVKIENPTQNDQENKKKIAQLERNESEKQLKKSNSLMKIENPTQNDQENQKMSVQFQNNNQETTLKNSNSERKLEENKHNYKENKRKIVQFERQDSDKQLQKSNSQQKLEENKQNDEESKRKVPELERTDSEKSLNNNTGEEIQPNTEEKSGKFDQLRRQLSIISQRTSNSNLRSPSSSNVISLPIYIAVPPGSYAKKEGEFTYASTTTEWKTFPVGPPVSKGIYKLRMRINKRSNITVGVMKQGLVVPFDKWPGYQPYAKDCIVFHDNGGVAQQSIYSSGNQKMKDGDQVDIEVNMEATPRTCHLFIDGQQQTVFVSGFPEAVQFWFFLNYVGDSISVLSLLKLNEPTVVKFSNEKELKWIIV